MERNIETIIQRLCGDMQTLFPQDRIEAILFGSYARGEADAGSDVDVLVFWSTPPDKRSLSATGR